MHETESKDFSLKRWIEVLRRTTYRVTRNGKSALEEQVRLTLDKTPEFKKSEEFWREFITELDRI
jgi:DNA-binding PadR family transcriptional regulator